LTLKTLAIKSLSPKVLSWLKCPKGNPLLRIIAAGKEVLRMPKAKMQ